MSDNNKPSKRLFLSDDDNSEDIALIQEISNKLRDSSISKDEQKDALSKLNEFRSKKIQPYFDKDKGIGAIHYGGWQFGDGYSSLSLKEDQDKLEPIYERLTTQKKQPLIIEPIKEEKSEPSTQEGFRFPNRNKLAKMEGEEETPPSNSILDKLLKKEREASPDVQVPRQVWNPDLGTFESSKDTVAKRPFSDKIFGSPEMRAAKKAEQYSSLMQDEEERAKQVDSSGRRMISKSPLLESYEKLLQIKPEEGRQISSVSEAPVRDGSPVVPEIKSIKEQKSAPVPKSSVSTGVGEDDSPEAKLNEAIKAESEKPQKSEMDFNEMLRMAQEARDKGVLLGNIGKAAETFATGLTGTVKGGIVTKPVGTDFYDKLIKQAEQPVEDVGTAYTMKTKQDEMDRLARRRDASSEESKFARDLLAQQGIKVPEAATAEALEKYAPQLTNIFNQSQARQAREADSKQRALDRAVLLEKGYSEKQEKAIISARDQVMTKGYKDAFDVYKNAERISNTFQNLSPGMYGDAIRTLQSSKLFQGDASVVRGPELKEVQNAVGVLDRLKNEVDRLSGTGKLQEDQRKQLLDAVNTIKNVAKKEYTGLLGPAAKQFNRRGLPLEEIFDPRVLPEVQESLGIKSEKEEQKIKKAIDGGYNKKTNQTQFIYEDGTSEIVDGNRTSEIVGVKR